MANHIILSEIGIISLHENHEKVNNTHEKNERNKKILRDENENEKVFDKKGGIKPMGTKISEDVIDINELKGNDNVKQWKKKSNVIKASLHTADDDDDDDDINEDDNTKNDNSARKKKDIVKNEGNLIIDKDNNHGNKKNSPHDSDNNTQTNKLTHKAANVNDLNKSTSSLPHDNDNKIPKKVNPFKKSTTPVMSYHNPPSPSSGEHSSSHGEHSSSPGENFSHKKHSSTSNREHSSPGEYSSSSNHSMTNPTNNPDPKIKKINPIPIPTRTVLFTPSTKEEETVQETTTNPPPPIPPKKSTSSPSSPLNPIPSKDPNSQILVYAQKKSTPETHTPTSPFASTIKKDTKTIKSDFKTKTDAKVIHDKGNDDSNTYIKNEKNLDIDKSTVIKKDKKGKKIEKKIDVDNDDDWVEF
jgi:hypothetical protein